MKIFGFYQSSIVNMQRVVTRIGNTWLENFQCRRSIIDNGIQALISIDNG